VAEGALRERAVMPVGLVLGRQVEEETGGGGTGGAEAPGG